MLLTTPESLESMLVSAHVDHRRLFADLRAAVVALAGLKFSEAMPRHLAVATLATRLADVDHSRIVLTEACRFEQLGRPLESVGSGKGMQQASTRQERHA